MKDLYPPVASAYSPRCETFRCVQQLLLYLVFTFSFSHGVTAAPCDGSVAAFRDWVQQRHAMDAEIPIFSTAYDPAQELFKVLRTNANMKSQYFFYVHGNSDGLTNVTIPSFNRDKQSQFYGNEVLYFEIYSANFRFGLIKPPAGHVVLPDTFTFEKIANEPTLKINQQLGAEYELPGSYTLGPEDAGFDQYLQTSGSLARSTQRTVDKANSYLKPEEGKWRIVKMEIKGRRNGSGNSDDHRIIRYDRITEFIVTVEKSTILPLNKPLFNGQVIDGQVVLTPDVGE